MAAVRRPKPRLGPQRPSPQRRMRELPVDAELLWTGRRAPNPRFTREGYGAITPIQVNGQWQIYGQRDDPVGAAAAPTLAGMDTERDRSLRWANEAVMPWASSMFGNLAASQTGTQTAFANALGLNATNAGNLAGATAPPAYAGTEGLATPRAVDTAAGAAISVARAQQSADTGAFGAAVRSLGMGATLQSQSGALASQVARLPQQFEQRKQKFLESLVPLRLQLAQSRLDRENARSQFLTEFDEGQRRFNTQTRIEAELSGAKLDQKQIELEMEQARDERDFNYQAEQDAIQNDQSQQRINAQRAGKAGKAPATNKEYAKTRAKWAENARAWMTPSSTIKRVNPQTGVEETVPSRTRFDDPADFFAAALAAGLTVGDAYKIMAANAPKQRPGGSETVVPGPDEVFRVLQRRFPKRTVAWLRTRTRQITGGVPSSVKLGPPTPVARR